MHVTTEAWCIVIPFVAGRAKDVLVSHFTRTMLSWSACCWSAIWLSVGSPWHASACQVEASWCWILNLIWSTFSMNYSLSSEPSGIGFTLLYSFFDEVEWKDSVQHVAESRLPSMMQDWLLLFRKDCDYLGLVRSFHLRDVFFLEFKAYMAGDIFRFFLPALLRLGIHISKYPRARVSPQFAPVNWQKDLLIEKREDEEPGLGLKCAARCVDAATSPAELNVRKSSSSFFLHSSAWYLMTRLWKITGSIGSHLWLNLFEQKATLRGLGQSWWHVEVPCHL